MLCEIAQTIVDFSFSLHALPVVIFQVSSTIGLIIKLLGGNAIKKYNIGK